MSNPSPNHGAFAPRADFFACHLAFNPKIANRPK
uniref:Uncharacterized protein n=2 Tax=unclassified Caudoviricetes TaxID=2788787 RepID=A0A8S5NWU2_9CAUD|nr:MAG TPA: hypothetical protein [Myoviridae sp. ctzUB9]DAE07664.1 MAG TPA: hypothetical protein [Myoviridae sp. ctIyl4]